MRSMGLPTTSDFFMETGSGTVLHTYQNEYPRGKSSWVKFQEIFCKDKTDKAVVIVRVESSIFDEMKPLLLQFMKTVFATVAARNAIQNNKDPMEIHSVAVNRCRSAGLEGNGLIFGSFLLHRAGPHHSYSDDRLLSFVNRHEAMFNETTFDTVAKVLAALDPLRARLGFDAYRLTNQVELTEKQFEIFEKDHKLLDFFKKHLAISSLHRNDALHPGHLQSMSEVDPAKIPKKLNGKSYGIVENFLKLPVQDKAYRDYLLSLTVGEYLVLRDLEIEVIPKSLLRDVSQYLIDSAALAKTVDGVRSAHELYLMVFDSWLTTGVPKSEIEQWYHWLLNTAPEKPATVKLLKDLINDENRVDEPCVVFKNIVEMLGSRNGQKWLTDGDFDDYVLSVLQSTVGADKALKAIQRVISSGEAVTVNQWVEVSKNFDMFIDVPVSWWSSMADDGDDDD